MSSWSTMAFTTSRAPLTMLTTPGGSFSSSSSSKRRCCEKGTCSLGLTTTVLPLAIAYGKNQNGTIDGKLYGAMIPKTPIGWRTEWQSMPLAICSRAPPAASIAAGVPHPTSTLSMPRRTSPLLSSRVLPCSCVQIDRSSS